jgi:hypothetical protein
MDAQGPERARHYAQAAHATYPVLVDQEGVLSSLYGFRAIPNGWIIDKEGVIRFRHLGGFDIRKSETVNAIEQILKGAVPEAADRAPEGPPNEATAAFQEGVRLLRGGRKRGALEAWMRAFELDPANFLVRKQIWHLLYPDKFEPEVDFAWQRAQMEQEARLGIRAANPLPNDLT